MADLNKVFRLLRVITMVISILLSVVVVVFGALLISVDSFFVAGFGIAIATIITVPVMLFISIIRRGAFTSMVVVELFWIGLLWVFWFLVGLITILRARSSGPFIAGFAFFNGLILMVLNITLFALAIRQSSRGNNIWTNDVTEADFSAPAPEAQVPSTHGWQGVRSGVPQQQPQFVPQQAQPYSPQQPQFVPFLQPPYMPQCAQV